MARSHRCPTTSQRGAAVQEGTATCPRSLRGAERGQMGFCLLRHTVASAHLSPKIQVGKIASHVNRPRFACASELPQISIPYVSPTWFTTRWVFGIVAEVLGMDLQTETTPTVQRIDRKSTRLNSSHLG